ncbi:peptidylprolyl isomerase [Sphingomonas panni]
MMKTTRRALLVALAFAGPALAQVPVPQPVAYAPLPRVAIVTTAGTLTVEVEVKRAPITAANFLRYVDQKRLDGTSFTAS